MRVIGIVRPKKGILYGSLEVGLTNQEESARHIIKLNINSEVVNVILKKGASRGLSPFSTNINSIAELDCKTINLTDMELCEFDFVSKEYAVKSDIL